ncbi:MAG TPA: GDP-mannose pyrophosphatase NudK [Vitreimonas sp.]|nr:GDP-mannose pyrophosphatase NudK [Vitreimonas sp.]
MNPAVKILETEILSDNWYTLKKVTFEYQRPDGSWETQSREAYDRGNGAVILLYHPTKKTVILTQQFRLPTYINGNESGLMIEACAGLLDKDNPEECIKRETEEETGYQIKNLQKIGEIYMSPGSVTEILYFYVAEYNEDMKVTDGGGLTDDQEHIKVLELPLVQALEMVKTGEIKDGKTIILLQHAQLAGLIK